MAENTQYARVKEITDQLEAGVKDLFDSDRYKMWLFTMSKFHNYSLNNTILIAQQKPDATAIASYTSWQRNFGRQVKKGEKAIKILAPTPYKKKMEVDKVDPDSGKVLLNPDGTNEKEVKEVLVPAFKVVNVFDISSTEGKELPTIGVDELSGDVKDYGLLFEALKESCPVPVAFENIEGGAKGYYHMTEHRIAIQEGMSEVQTVKTMIHEMAHQKLHSEDPKEMAPEDPKLTRNAQEVEAESISFALCKYYSGKFGEIDTSDYSFAYIASWSEGKDVPELKASMGRIRDAACEMINEIDGHLEELQKEQQKEQQKDQDRGEDQVKSSEPEKDQTQPKDQIFEPKKNPDQLKGKISETEEESEETAAAVTLKSEADAARDAKAEELAERIDTLSEDIDPYEYRDDVEDPIENIAMIKGDIIDQNESLELTIEWLMENVALDALTGPQEEETLSILDGIREYLGEDNPIVKEHFADWDPEKAKQEPGLQDNGKYRYYSTQRPIDLGTYPSPYGNKPVEITNFDSRIPVDGGKIEAWGYLEYKEPLSQDQYRSYELKPAAMSGEHVQGKENPEPEKKSVLEELHSKKEEVEQKKDTAEQPQKNKTNRKKEESR